MNGIDIHLSYTDLQDDLDGKWIAHYKSILDILISMFSGMIEFDSSRYQIFVISLIRISVEIPAYNIHHCPHGTHNSNCYDSNVSLIYHRHLVRLCTMAMAFYKQDGPGKYGIPAFGHVVVISLSLKYCLSNLLCT